MNAVVLVSVLLSAGLIADQALAASISQPPMNNFDYAFYTCDNGGAFQITYDSESPTQATLTTSDNNAQHTLKRAQVSNGVEFSGGNVTFWTDGKDTSVNGTQVALNHCKMK